MYEMCVITYGMVIGWLKGYYMMEFYWLGVDGWSCMWYWKLRIV